MEEREFLTVKEVAELLRVKPTTIYRKVKQGQLTGYSIGKNIRFKRDDINSFLEKGRLNEPEDEK